MPTWTNYGTPQFSLTIKDGQMFFSDEASPVKAELAHPRLSAFDFEMLIEIEAYLTEKAPPKIREEISLAGRFSFARYYSDNMGRGASKYNIWIQGRRMIITVREQPRLECTFEEFLRTGFSLERAAVIGEMAPFIVDGVRKLNALPCFCGTGAQTPEEHGDIKVIVSQQNPIAPVEHRVTVGRCAVCNRGWTFMMSGDPHYSYHYSVREYPPN